MANFKILPVIALITAMTLCRTVRAEVISYTLGIHMNCPYGLAR